MLIMHCLQAPPLQRQMGRRRADTTLPTANGLIRLLAKRADCAAGLDSCVAAVCCKQRAAGRLKDMQDLFVLRIVRVAR